MDKELIPYFENINDGGEQSKYLKEFGNDSVQNGICFHLTLSWMYLYKRAQTKAPNTIWNEMKNPAMIKQIANNQRAYSAENGSTDAIINANLQYYNLRQRVNKGSFNNWNNSTIANFVNNPALNNLMKLIVFHLFDKKGKIIGGHAIGTILHTGKFYLYDPNVGVMTVPSANSHELMDKIRYIYETSRGFVIRDIDIFCVG